MQAQRKVVTKIEANPLLSKHNNENALLRVAAYCRVSTDSTDQLESYRAQVDHYTQAIGKNPRWRFVEIYADEGISGTNAKKRDNFMKMIKDCEKGKIDLILTKSVSRFARNTVDSLNYVRKLKGMNVGVFFEEQNLDSLKADSEMFIGLHSVLAQAESENISANVRWGIQQRMRTGTFAFRYNILGYRKNDNGEPEIVENEAEIVREIFKMYVDGYSLEQIRVYLQVNGVLSPKGKCEWRRSIIQSMLTNERYVGDMILQKTYVENCITKKVKRNRGEMAKYLITNNHPAIIDRAVFKQVQNEIARRSSTRKTSDKCTTDNGKYSGKYALSELLICGECGSSYRRKIWTYKGNRKVVWRCISRIDNGSTYCKDSKSIEETALQTAIMRGLSNSLKNKEEVASLIESNLTYGATGNETALSVYAIESQLVSYDSQMQTAVMMITSTEGDPSQYIDTVKQCTEQINILKEQLAIAKEQLSSNENCSDEIARIKNILATDLIEFKEYNDFIVRQLIEHIVVQNTSLKIMLKGGIEIVETI